MWVGIQILMIQEEIESKANQMQVTGIIYKVSGHQSVTNWRDSGRRYWNVFCVGGLFISHTVHVDIVWACLLSMIDEEQEEDVV